MRRAQPSIARDRESAAMAWDGLGLAERDRLVFGGPPPRPARTADAEVAAPTPNPERLSPTPGPRRGRGRAGRVGARCAAA